MLIYLFIYLFPNQSFQWRTPCALKLLEKGCQGRKGISHSCSPFYSVSSVESPGKVAVFCVTFSYTSKNFSLPTFSTFAPSFSYPFCSILQCIMCWLTSSAHLGRHHVRSGFVWSNVRGKTGGSARLGKCLKYKCSFTKMHCQRTFTAMTELANWWLFVEYLATTKQSGFCCS